GAFLGLGQHFCGNFCRRHETVDVNAVEAKEAVGRQDHDLEPPDRMAAAIHSAASSCPTFLLWPMPGLYSILATESAKLAHRFRSASVAACQTSNPSGLQSQHIVPS